MSQSVTRQLSLINKEEDCGNNVLDTGEACDDGNDGDGDGCSSECSIEDGWSCISGRDPECQEIECGDWVITEPETCDIGSLKSPG